MKISARDETLATYLQKKDKMNPNPNPGIPDPKFVDLIFCLYL